MKKLISIFLCVVLCCSVFALRAQAVTKYYGIIAMDFCDTDNEGDFEKQDFGSDTLVRMIFETNFDMLHC